MVSKTAIIGMVLVSVSLGSIGQLLMKKGMTLFGEVSFSSKDLKKLIFMFFQPHVFAGLMLYGFSVIIWLVMLSKADLSFIYPFISLGFVLTAIFGYVFFKEMFNIQKIVGIGLIVLGAVLVGLGRFKTS